jgi:hypothetical protein
MLKLVSAGASVLIAALVLSACSTSAHSESRSWAAGCARAEADVRVATLEAGPFTGVMTPQDMIVAEKRWEALGPEKLAADKALRRIAFTGPGKSLKAVPFPPPLARQMRRIDADLNAFGAARLGYQPHRSPQPIGDAAQKLMRDIRVVQAACSRLRTRVQP